MTTRPRSRIDSARHAGCASMARPTARATSSGMVNGARPISPPVAGSRTIISGRSDLAGMLWAIAEDYRAEARAMKDKSIPLLLSAIYFAPSALKVGRRSESRDSKVTAENAETFAADRRGETALSAVHFRRTLGLSYNTTPKSKAIEERQC